MGLLFRILAVLLLLVGLSAAAMSYWAWRWLQTESVVPEQNSVFVVPQGSNLHKVSRQLQQRGLMNWPQVWIAYARITKTAQIRAGEYALNSSESPLSLLEKFRRGEVIQYSITFVEGITLREAFTQLHAHPKVNKSLVWPLTKEDLGIGKLDGTSLEGWFFPDTYRFVAGDSDRSILLRAHRRMQALLKAEWLERADDLPYNTAYEALIMASIVEKETGAPHEREQIAGVFERRLQRGMRLQTDPTVIYGLGERYDGNITRAHLRESTPFNTYVIRGLPPTPIALPGREAIRAALRPAPGDALYFVARGDGTHIFSATLDAHMDAVRRYQHRRRAGYRSNYVDHEGADDSSNVDDSQSIPDAPAVEKEGAL